MRTAALAIVTLLFAGIAHGAPASLALESCHVAGTDEPARCGTLEVYEDRAAARGRRIPINVVVFGAKSDNRAPDPVFVIPGGPGQSAVEFAWFLLRDLAFARARRDIVFIDQRGTGGSNPLSCDLGTTLNDIVHAIGIGVDADLDGVRACRRELEKKADLRLYTTAIAMDDLDEVRAALGYERINLFAASYGTRAALVYMRQHPGRVRSAILRALGSVDLKLPVTVGPDAQRAFDRLIAACQADRHCRERFPGIEAELKTTLARLTLSPVTVSVIDPRTREPVDVRVDADVFGSGIFFLLFATEWSRHLPYVVHAAARGRFQPFATIVVPVMAASAMPVHWGMRRSVLCAEDVPLVTAEEVRKAGQTSVFGAVSDLGLLASCRHWPAGVTPSGFSDPIKTDVPILAISGEEDPVLPPRRAESALRYLSRALHVVVPGTGHGPNFPGCVRELAAQFLELGTTESLRPSCVASIERPAFAIPK
jgi:pimeloyl-ACP methyl ester carboxylesterase